MTSIDRPLGSTSHNRRKTSAPGEFTDDMQMALLVATSLVEHGGLDEADVFGRFRAWAEAGPPDIGNQTRAVLGSGRPWDVAAAEHFTRSGHAAIVWSPARSRRHTRADRPRLTRSEHTLLVRVPPAH
ncbi:ADP-ribosylglycohydrolase family protein [Blastococcus sp. SYSU DS0539]